VARGIIREGLIRGTLQQRKSFLEDYSRQYRVSLRGGVFFSLKCSRGSDGPRLDSFRILGGEKLDDFSGTIEGGKQDQGPQKTSEKRTFPEMSPPDSFLRSRENRGRGGGGSVRHDLRSSSAVTQTSFDGTLGQTWTGIFGGNSQRSVWPKRREGGSRIIVYALRGKGSRKVISQEKKGKRYNGVHSLLYVIEPSQHEDKGGPKW